MPNTQRHLSSTPPQTAIGFNELARIGERMQTNWGLIIRDEGGKLPRPSTLSLGWGLNQTLCTRLLQALKETDPVQALSRFPSPGSLKSVLINAKAMSVEPDRIAEAHRTVQELEAVIAHFGGTKSNLDTMISRQLDHSREKIEQNAKQLIFRGMTSLYGVEAQTTIIMCFAFPSSDPEHIDELVVHGYHGLRRLRPELPLMLGTREILPDCNDQKMALLDTLHDGKIDTDGDTTALHHFCTDPFPEIEVRKEQDRLIYALAAQPDQLGGELDLFFSSMHRKSDPRFAQANHPRLRHAYIPHTPSRQLVFDVYIHKDLWPGVEPELILAKVGNPNAPDLLAHSLDRMDFIESLQNIGSSPTAFSSPHYGRYHELVQSIHTEMKWEMGDFRVFRCAVKYAIVGLWYTIQFQLPDR